MRKFWVLTTKGVEMKGSDIQERLTDFAVRVMELCDELPKTFAGRHLGEQLFRAGTAGAANYAEVRGAESRNDFIYKLGIVLKELNESRVWLRMVQMREMISPGLVESVSKECDELCRIIAVSRRTAERNSSEIKN
jgi:four helix bundle protein